MIAPAKQADIRKRYQENGNRLISEMRQTIHQWRQDYDAVRETRNYRIPCDIVQYGSGADYHYRREQDYYLLIELGRHLDRNNRVVAQGVNRLCRNIVQGGFQYRPQLGNDRDEATLKQWWKESTEDKLAFSYDGEKDFRQSEFLNLRSSIVDGDIGANPLKDRRLQMVEGHRIRNPTLSSAATGIYGNRPIVHGVEKLINGPRYRYWVLKRDYNGFVFSVNIGDTRPVFAWSRNPITGQMERNFLHIAHPNRWSQTRGVTKMVPVVKDADLFDDIVAARVQQQELASFMGTKHKVPETTENYRGPLSGTLEEQDPCESGLYNQVRPLGVTADLWPDYPGEEIDLITASVPNPEYFDFAMHILTFVSINLDLPLTLLLLDAGKKNFSGQRFELEQAKISFRDFQRTYASCYHTPYHRIRLLQEMTVRPDLLAIYRRHGEAVFHPEWGFPGWPYIEPFKDVQADALEISNTMSSPSEVAARRGKDYRMTATQSCIDRAYLIQCAMDEAMILNDHPYIRLHPDERVTWREVAHHPLPQGFQMQLLDEVADDEVASTNQAA